jgi:hypothetical protein
LRGGRGADAENFHHKLFEQFNPLKKLPESGKPLSGCKR